MVAASCTNKIAGTQPMPQCLQKKINEMTATPGNAPASVTEYTYQGEKVYYMIAPCCDQFNLVFDKDCNILGRPDGGITGKGDGSLPHFWSEAKDPKVIWKNQ